MSLRTTATSALGVAAVVAAAGVATGASASASTALENQTCTMTYSGVGAPAAQTFTTGVQWAYAEHGDVTGTPAGVYMPDHETQIGLPEAVVLRMAETGVGHNTPVSGAEYYTVNGVAGTAPMSSSAVPINNIHGVMDLTVGGGPNTVAIPAGVDTSKAVALKHAATTVTWKSDKGITGTLTCGTIPAATKPSDPATTKPSDPATTKPSVPATTKPSVPATKPATPGTTPAMPAQPATPGQGPKVQTDNVSEGSNAGTTAAFGGAAALALAGTAVAARRRKN